MRAAAYLPSKQFSLIVFSFLLSASLVYAADKVTRYEPASLSVDTNPSVTPSDPNWQAALAAVQEQSGAQLPQPPDADTVNALIQAAQSSNITDSISRTLLVNLTDAKAQGLGDDIPTQDQLISKALSQIPSTQGQYAQGDLSVVRDSPEAMKAYGNALAAVIVQDSGANNEYGKTLTAVDNATSLNDASALDALPALQTQYETLTADLVRTPVPQTLAPFHLALVNDFSKIAGTYPGLEHLMSDPIAGLAALQQFNSDTSEAQRVFINIAQALDKNGILFDNDEPGALWAALLQLQQQ